MALAEASSATLVAQPATAPARAKARTVDQG
jgi:hypothetical protein